jgi:hypothetical protein
MGCTEEARSGSVEEPLTELQQVLSALATSSAAQAQESCDMRAFFTSGINSFAVITQQSASSVAASAELGQMQMKHLDEAVAAFKAVHMQQVIFNSKTEEAIAQLKSGMAAMQEEMRNFSRACSSPVWPSQDERASKIQKTYNFGKGAARRALNRIVNRRRRLQVIPWLLT